MKALTILIRIWGQEHREIVEKNLFQRSSKNHLNLSVDSINEARVIFKLNLSLISINRAGNITDADLGEIIRLITQDAGCFVEITGISIS